MNVIYKPDITTNFEIPLFNPVQCGFPSPADDYVFETLNLNEHLIQHPFNTFFVRAKGDSMHAKIFDGDLLIVDKSLTPKHGSVVVAFINGEFMVKRLYKYKGKIFLVPDNPKYQKTEINETSDFKIWGVATHAVTKL
jgi:DNA polymerase V